MGDFYRKRLCLTFAMNVHPVTAFTEEVLYTEMCNDALIHQFTHFPDKLLYRPVAPVLEKTFTASLL